MATAFVVGMTMQDFGSRLVGSHISNEQLASFAILLVTKAMRTGEISAVIPFRYSRLFFGLLVGTVVLGETVNQTMIIGSATIIFAGLYTWLRERQITQNS